MGQMNPVYNPYLFNVILWQNSQMVPSLQVYRLKLYTHFTPFDLIIQTYVMFGEEYNFFNSLIPIFFNTHLISSVQHCLAKFIVLFSWDTKPIFTTIQTKMLLLIFKFSSTITELLTCFLKTPGSNLDRHFSSPEVSIVFLTPCNRISEPLF